LVRTLDAQFDEDLERSVRIEPGRWDGRSGLHKDLETIISSARRFF